MNSREADGWTIAVAITGGLGMAGAAAATLLGMLVGWLFVVPFLAVALALRIRQRQLREYEDEALIRALRLSLEDQ